MRKFLLLSAILALGMSLLAFSQQQNFPGVTVSATGGGTTNTIPKFTSTGAIGNSSLTDNGTIVSTTEPISASTSAGPLMGTVASGTAAMGTTAITSGTCAAVVTVSAPAVATTDSVTAGFNGDPTAVTGYGVSGAGAVLTIYAYPTANNVNFKVCNSTAAAITPAALTLNWKVGR